MAVLTVILILAVACPAEAAKKKKRRVTGPNNRYASIIVDADTGRVLSEKNADKKLYPASLTKMMTLYLTFEAIENGTLRKNERIPVSRHAANQEPSSLGLEAGTTIRVEDAIYALVTKSANDAAMALGEYLGDGMQSRFAQRMNAKARALGMTNSRFVNPSGLFDPAQVSTARDMARLGIALIRDYPRSYRYFSTSSFTWAGQVMNNHNHLMKTYRGMDGIKTGYVRQSGFNLAASAVQDGRRLVGVVFGGRTTKTRNAEMAKLLDNGFALLNNPRLAEAAPKFGALGMVMKKNAPAREEEGDADIPGNPAFRPNPISTQTLGAYSDNGGDWVVQIGAFGNKNAGFRALKKARERLARLKGANGAVPIVVPLATNRGTIYRARLAGFDRDAAEKACRILKGNCLILAMQ